MKRSTSSNRFKAAADAASVAGSVVSGSGSSVNSNDRRLLQRIESNHRNRTRGGDDQSIDTMDLFNMLDEQMNGSKGGGGGSVVSSSVYASDNEGRRSGRNRGGRGGTTTSRPSRHTNGFAAEDSSYRSFLSNLPGGGRSRSSRNSPSTTTQSLSSYSRNNDEEADNHEMIMTSISDHLDIDALRRCMRQTEQYDSRRLLVMGVAALLFIASIYNMSRYQLNNYTSKEQSMMLLSEEQRRGTTQQDNTAPFVMCNRETPFQYEINPLLPPAEQKPLNKFENDWEKQDKILLLRNDGKFGHIGNQVNSLLHAFDYARDHKLDLGILFHSWAMDVIHTMFYETDNFEDLGYELLEDLGIKVIRNQTQLEGYSEVISQNSQQLYFYRSSNLGVDHWRETMRVHIEILQRLYLRYNRGYGYVHNGLRAQDLCGTLDMFFHEKAADVKYTVIHTRYQKENTEWRLEKIAKTTGLTIEGGAMIMGPAYIKSILKPLGMLEYPIILITDGQLPSVERGLLNDEVLGPKLMVLSNKQALEGADVALAVLADVFIGNPASVTSGFIARSRVALGYSEKSTQLFRRKRIHQWYSVCNEECVFNPWILGQWV